MKRLLLTLAMVLGLGLAAYAQPRAIGVRLGGDADFSYEHQLGNNMIDLEVGVPGFFNAFDGHWGVHAACTYDWIFKFNSWSGKGEWNWYPGVGLAGGFYNCKAEDHNGHGFLGIAGRIGVEYNFWFPLQLSLDYRPVIGYGFNHGFYDAGFYGVALGVRYRFN